MTKTKQLISFTILSLAIIGSRTSHKVFAATLNVPSQYSSIQGAINAASNGDTVLVSPGTYREQLAIVGKYIEVRSSGGFNNTTLAPNPGATGIMIQQVPYQPGLPRVKVSGFKITGGYSPDGQGGAITIANNADPIIDSNNIDHNKSTVDGGGILVYNNSQPTIRNNIITYNSASTFGGGIFAVKSSSPVIYGNTISNNSVSGASIPNGGSSGGGIYLENDSANASALASPVVTANTISNNSAQFAGGGVMLRTGVKAIIEENTIDNNNAPYGGGIHIETEGSSPVIANNVISNNKSNYDTLFAGSGHGAGISVYAASKPRIFKNQILSNTSTYGGAGIVLAEGSNSNISDNNLVNNNVIATGGNTEGGGIYIANATATVYNNLIRGNSGWNGGGIGVLVNSTITIMNNTIVKNNDTHANIGGGIFIENANVAVTITNNIIALNQQYQVYEGNNKKAVFTNNLIRDDGTGLYDNAVSSSIHTAAILNSSPNNVIASGTLDTDPQFTDSSTDDYTIQSTSPAKDTGISSGAPSDDYRRAQRPFGAGYDIGAYEYTTETNFKSPVYRFWSAEVHGHFYTADKNEKNYVLSNYPVSTWQYEFEAYDAFSTSVTNSVPIYRIYHPQRQAHTYLTDLAEKNAAVTTGGWADEGIAFYVYPTSYNGSYPTNTVYRFWSPTYQHHFFTASQAEHDFLINNYPPSIWTDEGSRFKVPL